jgi:hypothetical protein
MTFSAEFLLQVLIALGSGAGVYAAIRADLARLQEQSLNNAKTADHAHRRIDDILERRTP